MNFQRVTIRAGEVRRAGLTFFLLTMWLVALGLQGCSTLGTHSQQPPDLKPRQVQATFLRTPLHFEANQGQTDSEVKFLSRGPGYGLFLTPSEAVLALSKANSTQSEAATDETPSVSAVLRMRLVGANPTPELSGETVLPGKVNYFTGNDPTKWRTNVPTYGKARYENVYPGIDLVYYGNQRQLEYDFVVAPGQDPASITMAFEGAERLELDASGDLVLHTEGGVVRQRKPIIYQEVGGQRHDIAGDYLLKPDDHVGFQVAAYDVTKPLIVDPILVFSTLLGGNDIDGAGDIAVDGVGQVYVSGATRSLDFPTQHSFKPVNGGEGDVFVAKLTADGSALVYSTFLGGSGSDGAGGIAVDGEGQVYVTGSTSSFDFPTLNPFQADLQPTLVSCPPGAGLGGICELPGKDAFVTKLTSDGSALVYSTYLGGSMEDTGNAIAVGDAGRANVTGTTGLKENSAINPDDFPTENPIQASHGGSQMGVSPNDAFVAQLSTDGSTLNFSTFLGGSRDDRGFSIAVDGLGQVYVTGETSSADFPTQNPIQPGFAGPFFSDAFVAKLTPDGSALVYSTYLGGETGLDRGSGIAVDAVGQAYVTGTTFSFDFPTVNPFQPGGGVSNAFVAKLTADGSALVYSTYLGGDDDHNSGGDITVDAGGQAYVTGTTFSGTFPTKNPIQSGREGLIGTSDAFVAQFNEAGTALLFSTYLGGTEDDAGGGIAVNRAGQVYVTGGTRSTDFPTMHPFQPGLDGLSDAFVAKIDPLRQNLNDQFAPLGPGDVTTAFSRTPCGGASAGTFTITATFTNISADTLSNLVIAVNTLTGGNVLCNSNGAPGGAGATLTVPLEGDLADGQLSPGEAFVVELPVGLQSFNPFTFVVDVLGEVD